MQAPLLQVRLASQPLSALQRARHGGPAAVSYRSLRTRKVQDGPLNRLEIVCSSQRSDDAAEGSRGAEPGQVPDSLPLASAGTDWREFRAQLVANAAQQQREQQQPDGAGPAPAPRGGSLDPGGGVWAHPIPQPEKGCLLIAHPLMFTSTQVYFSQVWKWDRPARGGSGTGDKQLKKEIDVDMGKSGIQVHCGRMQNLEAVIFLFEHSESGSAGLILNRRTSYNIGSLTGADMLCPEFADNVLHLGGDVGSDMLHVLHPHGDVRSVVEVVNGVFLGSPEGAYESVRSGQHPASDFRWFTRYAGWAPGQLQHECRAGVWFPAAAGRGVILPPLEETGRATWHRVLELMGGDYADLSRGVRETSLPDVLGAPPPGGSESDAGQ